MKDRKLLGDLGEEMAAGILYAEGYDILERKFRCRLGDVATQILIQTNSRGHPLNVLVSRRLEDKCSRYSFKKISYPIDKSKSDK